MTVDINRIKNVLVTHIHLDHSGGAWKFAKNGANIYVHPKGSPHLISPERLMSSATIIYGDQMGILWGSVEDISSEKVISVDHKQIIRIGSLEFKALHTPGHASHHIAWVFNDVVFTGDVAGAKIQNGPVLPACPPPDIDLEKWEDSLKILEKENPKKMYLTHFGEHKNIRSHIDELREALSDWSLWINEKRKIFLDDEIRSSVFSIGDKRCQSHHSTILTYWSLFQKILIRKTESEGPNYYTIVGLLQYLSLGQR